MIIIECDNCEKTISVEDTLAGQKVPCPECGDVNRVPEAKPAEPAPAAADEGDDVVSRDGAEQEIDVVRPAMFRAHPFRYLLILAMFLGGLALVVGSFSEAWKASFSWAVYPGGLLAVIALGWFGVWWISTHWWIRLVISNKRSVRHEGIIRRHTTEVLHDHVRSVDIDQTFLQRILSVGCIGIDSAGQDGVEIEVKDIPRPYEVKALIDRYRKM